MGIRRSHVLRAHACEPMGTFQSMKARLLSDPGLHFVPFDVSNCSFGLPLSPLPRRYRLRIGPQLFPLLSRFTPDGRYGLVPEKITALVRLLARAAPYRR